MEYARFGAGFVKRLNSDHEWEPCDAAEIPSEWFRTNDVKNSLRPVVGTPGRFEFRERR